MKKQRIILSVLLVVFLAAGFSCSVKQDLNLELSGRGHGRIEVVLDSLLMEYLTDLSLVMTEHPNPETLPVFDENAIWEAFDQSPEIRLLSVELPRRDTLILEFNVRDVDKAFRDLTGESSSGKSPLSFRRNGNLAVWEFFLTAQGFYQIMNYFPLVDQSLLEYFGPNPDSPIPEELYKEDLEIAFEEYLEGRSIDPILAASKVTIFVRTDGEIRSVTGGRKVPGGALFETPVIRFLTLTEPVEYRLEFSASGSP